LIQTADVSEADKSTDDDKDDRLSRPEMSGRGKARASSRATRVVTMNINLPERTNNNPTQISTTNKSESLRHAETEGNSRHEREGPAPTSDIRSRNGTNAGD
jgi:hypothetical protein